MLGASATHPNPCFFVATATTAYLRWSIGSAASTTIDNISVKEIPASQYKYALSFGGVDDYYSLLNAIPITTNMTVVRAFKRASAGLKSVGLGSSTSGKHRETFWWSNNINYIGMGDGQAGGLRRGDGERLRRGFGRGFLGRGLGFLLGGGLAGFRGGRLAARGFAFGHRVFS